MEIEYRVGIWDRQYRTYTEYDSHTFLGAFWDYWVRGFGKPKQFSKKYI